MTQGVKGTGLRGNEAKQHHNAMQRERRKTPERKAKDKGVHKECEIRRKYGMGTEEYDRLRQQATHCPICGEEMNETHRDRKCKHLDHDHDTGKVRGFICSACNLALGNFQDSEALLQRALDWIRGHK